VKIWRQDGAVGFFRGIIPNILKVVPSSALTFLVYEETLKLLSDSS
jgi:solute carrier family 25 folate transporter 32